MIHTLLTQRWHQVFIKIPRSQFCGSHAIAHLNISRCAINSKLPNFILPGLETLLSAKLTNVINVYKPWSFFTVFEDILKLLKSPFFFGSHVPSSFPFYNKGNANWAITQLQQWHTLSYFKILWLQQLQWQKCMPQRNDLSLNQKADKA